MPGAGVPGTPAAGAATPPGGVAAGRHGDPEGLSIGELFAEVSRDLSTLIRQEIELAKAETTASAKRAGKGAGLLGGAGYAGHLTVLFLSIALWWGLGALVNRGWSAVIVAVIWGIVAAVLAARGRKELKQTPGLEETTDSLKKIPNALQGHEEKNR
ncbi:phage holin family protein [Puerhibacterium puerhi]|uniref:phage holin family protein n=1 Tax=Puerhibacterium puerhi TaxID=2692623 RepID=UPI0013583246